MAIAFCTPRLTICPHWTCYEIYTLVQAVDMTLAEHDGKLTQKDIKRFLIYPVCNQNS